MDTPRTETPIHLPWDTELVRSLIAYPPYSEHDPGDQRSPEIPLLRVQPGGAVAILNWFGRGFLPAGTVRWWFQPPVQAAAHPHPHSAADPFTSATVLGVDFWVSEGRLVLLERIALGDGKESSRLAVLADGAAPVLRDPLDGGPYVRIVPDDRGRVFLVSRGEGNVLSELDLQTGALDRRHAAAPGTRAALAAGRGGVVAAALLDQPDPARVAAPAALPTALTYLFGFDGKDYYSLVDGEIAVISFDGKVQRRIALGGPALVPPAAAPGGIVTRLAPSTAWQVDGDGNVYIPKVGPDAFEALRLRTR